MLVPCIKLESQLVASVPQVPAGAPTNMLLPPNVAFLGAEEILVWSPFGMAF